MNNGVFRQVVARIRRTGCRLLRRIARIHENGTLVRVIVAGVIVAGTLAVARLEMHRQDREDARIQEVSARLRAERDYDLKAMPAREFFRRETESNSFMFVGEGIANSGPLSIAGESDVDAFPWLVSVRTKPCDEAPEANASSVAGTLVEVAISEVPEIRKGTLLYIYRVNLPRLNRRSNEIVGTARERFLGTLSMFPRKAHVAARKLSAEN